MAEEADFDPNDRDSWYFGPVSREEANGILNDRVDSGTFLIRDSSTMRGDYVLCVREDQRVSHYIINQILVEGDQKQLRIGDQEFSDLPSLLSFYRTHYLDTTALIKPAPRPRLFCRAKYPFPGSDREDLPFAKNEILEILRKDEPQWWTAKNRQGAVGLVPKPYIEPCDVDALDGDPMLGGGDSSGPHTGSGQNNDANPSSSSNAASGATRVLPARARVIKARIPNAYDSSALKLEVGDIVTVTNTPVNGMWEGELNGKSGNFPFTHVELLEDGESQ